MRLNFILVAVIIAALIASGFFIFRYFNKSSKIEELEVQIATSNKQIQELTLSSETLAKEIVDLRIIQTTLQDAIMAENPSISVNTNPNEVIRNIMELGLKHRTSVIPLLNSGWTEERASQGDYQVLRINLTVGSSEDSIINFVNDLQDLYPTLVIESLRIRTLITTNTSDSGTLNETAIDDITQSIINIAIYSR